MFQFGGSNLQASNDQSSIQNSVVKPQCNPKPHKSSEYLIRKIIQFRDPNTNTPLINKYSLLYLITLLDKNKIQSIDKVYKIKQEGFNLLQFIRFFLNAIEHSEIQTLYLTMGLVDFFKTISENNNFAERIKFIQLTDFVCNNILENNLALDANNAFASITGCSNTYAQNKLEMKLIPSHKPIIPDYKIKEYITNPPRIYGNKEETVYKLSSTNTKVDKNKHDSVVIQSFFSFQYKKVFSLDALADGISIYDTNCRLLKKLRPQYSKVKKDVVLLAFAYSQRQERIGAVLKDFTLSFWDFADNLEFQKVISTASCCPQYQTNIWYLEYFQAWITSDKTGTIYIWNLEKQIPQRKIQCKYKGKINDVCEIPCLNILAIAQQCRFNRANPNKKQAQQAKIVLYDYFRGEQVGQISAMNDMRIPHTLQYSQTYQVLLSAGFEKKINIFEINHKYLDTNLKGELLGHENLITNFTLVKKTPMVVSSDDKGKVKIWDIRNYKCIQTLDFRDKTVITRLLDMVEIGKLGVLGSRINFLEYDQRLEIVKKYQSKQKNLPLAINCIYESNKLLIVTKKDIRLYNMQTGAIQKVFCDYHNKDEEIVVFKYYELMKKVLIGNEKGEIKLFNFGGISTNGKVQNVSSDGKPIKDEKLQGFQNGLVTHIQYDQDNKLFLTCGQNGTINIQKLIKNNPQTRQVESQDSNQDSRIGIKQSKRDKFVFQDIEQSQQKQKPSKPLNTEDWTVIRQMKGNFHSKDITTLALSVYHGMIAIGSTCNQVYVWDYEYAKILFFISLPQGTEPTAMTFLNGFSILVIAAGNGEVYFVKLLRSNEHQYQERSMQKSSTAKVILPEQLLSFKDNRSIKKIENKLLISDEEDPNDYITELMVDVCLKGIQSKSQNLEFVKLYVAYYSGKMAILNLSEFLKRHPILPHRKNLPTYNPERQLKQQFSIQLQKQKCLRLDIKPVSHQEEFIQKKLPYDYKFVKPHNSSINSMRILQFDKHYLVTCGNDERIKIWDETELFKESQNFVQSSSLSNVIAKQIKLLGDFNVNHPLPYLWNFSIKEEKKTKDKIMFSLKIIQSIFKKFGSDISTGQSKILKLQNFFKLLQKSDSKQDQFGYLTQPLQNPTQTTKKPYLFHEEFSKKDLHYDDIKKFNFYEIGGPSLRELEFKKKLDIMQKQWQTSKIKEEEQKNQLMSKIQHRAQKNEEKQQIINFLQDRQFIKKRLRKEDEEQFPMVKRINEELKKIETHESMSTQSKEQNGNSLMFSETKTLIQPNSLTGKLNKIVCYIADNSTISHEKQEYGCLLRRYHHSTGSTKSSLKSKNPKGFQDYYKRKMNTKAETTQNSRLNTNDMLNEDKKTDYHSLVNSRVVSQSSLHKKSQKQLSFQHILKDMNNRVLLSRQARHPTTVYKENAQLKDQLRKYQFPTQRQSRTNRLAKTHYANPFRSRQNQRLASRNV